MKISGKFIKYMTAVCIAAAAVSFAVFSASASGLKTEKMSVSYNETVNVPTFVIWANGRDVKSSSKLPGSDDQRYKTGVYQHIMMSAGGKWNVAVTETAVSTAEEFIKLLDAKGKFIYAKAAETKQVATAKIKDGEITVTAGKVSGMVNIWVYETNKNGVVYMPEYDITPKHYLAEVKMSSSAPVLAEVGNIRGGVLKQGASAVTKLNIIYDNHENAVQTSIELSLGDKKDVPTTTTTYSITYSNADKTTTPSVVSAILSADNSTLFITPVKVGKTTVSITNNQSGKAAKLSIEVKNKYPVTFDPALVEVLDMTNKNDPVKVKNNDELIDGTTLKITAIPSVRVDQITVAGKTIKSGGTVKINGAAVDISAGRTYAVTMTGSDKTNTVKDGTKAIKNGAAFLAGKKLTLSLDTGIKAEVISGGNKSEYTGDGAKNFEFEILGDTTVTFTRPTPQ